MATKLFKADKAKSSIAWTGKKVTGQHNGTINFTDGNIETANDNIIGGSFDIDTTSIVILDIKDPATNAQFKGHLFSDDFFAVEKFPTANFLIFNVTHKTGNQYKIDGTLTIKDIAHSLSFDAEIAFEQNNISVKGQIIVDRTKYGMKFGSGNFFKGLGDTLIYNDFVLDINLAASSN
jgi:polyisoprenoid-binding protein YceI